MEMGVSHLSMAGGCSRTAEHLKRLSPVQVWLVYRTGALQGTGRKCIMHDLWEGIHECHLARVKLGRKKSWRDT